MFIKDTHLILSDLAWAVARLQSYTFVTINSSHMQLATRQVRLDHTFNCYFLLSI